MVIASTQLEAMNQCGKPNASHWDPHLGQAKDADVDGRLLIELKPQCCHKGTQWLIHVDSVSLQTAG